MSEPSEQAKQAAEKIAHLGATGFDRKCEIIQQAIDAALADQREELSDLKARLISAEMKLVNREQQPGATSPDVKELASEAAEEVCEGLLNEEEIANIFRIYLKQAREPLMKAAEEAIALIIQVLLGTGIDRAKLVKAKNRLQAAIASTTKN